MLTTLGLEKTVETVYRGMLTQPDLGVLALAAELGLTESATRDALDELSELCLVRPSAESTGRLRAVSPDIGMEILMARQQAELAAQQQRLETSRAAAAQLISEYAELRPATAEPGVEQLVGLDRIRDRLITFTREARCEVLAFSPNSHLPQDAIDAARPLNAEVLGRGVRMRTIYLESVRNSRLSIDHANWLASIGGQVRTAATLPTRMIIFDGAAAVIPVSSDDTAAGAVVLTGQGTLSALSALFESTWAAALPLSDVPVAGAGGLTAQQSTAVKLLARGLTDEAIAKRLGVSPRTARRIATDLMERLGARSRFEAGVLAVQRNWLPAHS